MAPDLYAVNGVRPVAATRERMMELRQFMDKLGPAGFTDPAVRSQAIAKLPTPTKARVEETFAATVATVVSGKANFGAYVQALVAGAQFLRGSYPLSRGHKVGVVGFCMGGSLALNLACLDPELAGAVCFYGRAPQADQVALIRAPVLGLYGALDEGVNAGIPAFTEAMKAHGKSLETHIYPDAPHAFFNNERPSYHAEAAADAYERTLNFFKRCLA